jgi:phospholipid/cholesterol/gamma-HCH transport system substrate-binding protein
MNLSTPAKVGIITLISLIALAVVITWKTELLLMREGYRLTGSFESIEGLTIGSEVRYRGFKVGKILNIDPGPYDIKVYAVVNNAIKFPSDSSLRIAYDGIVGLKYLEIRPGSSEALYDSSQVLVGIKTAGIVDFVDIGSQNLVETKKIMENIRMIVENKALQSSIINTAVTADKLSGDLEKLVLEIRKTNQGIQDVVADPAFQQNVKGTIQETKKTLSSANSFFESVGKINVRATGGVDLGSRSNAARGNVDVIQSENNYLRVGMGEGPTRQLSVLDVLFNSRVAQDFGFRLGVINNQLGGGLAFYPSRKVTFRGDIYDVNNPRPNWPKLRLGYEYEMAEYRDLALNADDILNRESRNFTIGISVKPLGARIY